MNDEKMRVKMVILMMMKIMKIRIEVIEMEIRYIKKIRRNGK
jgi:hypothetical protein